MRRNLLIDKLPEALEVAGRCYAVRTDFRIGLLFEMLLASPLSDAHKVERALSLYYAEVPEDTLGAFDGVLWFFGGGDAEARRGGQRGKNQARIYDYDADAELLYAAFLDQYGLDLADIGHLHWWKFRALFRGLREDHMLSRVMAIRAMDTKGIKSRDERARIRALQDMVRVDGRRTEGAAVDMEGKAGVLFGGGLGGM